MIGTDSFFAQTIGNIIVVIGKSRPSIELPFIFQTLPASELVIDIERLKAAPKKPSSWYRPQIERKGSGPHSIEERDYLQVGRHEQPNQVEQEDKWAKR